MYDFYYLLNIKTHDSYIKKFENLDVFQRHIYVCYTVNFE